MADKRRINRRDFTYYMQVKDAVSKQTVGYLADISTSGFKLDTQMEIPPGKDFRLLIDLTPDIANQNSMIFIARSKWCRRDHVDPFTFNVGFEITNMAPGDMLIFQRMFDKYGSQKAVKGKSSNDYLWK